jgi:hypothetical protein
LLVGLNICQNLIFSMNLSWLMIAGADVIFELLRTIVVHCLHSGFVGHLNLKARERIDEGNWTILSRFEGQGILHLGQMPKTPARIMLAEVENA